MPYTRRIFDLLPQSIRFQESFNVGGLEHFISVVQADLDILIDKIEMEEYYYDPSQSPPAFLNYLGQIVGLSDANGFFLGRGIDPNLPIQEKRDVIERAWTYWQIKGSNLGIEEAISIWLRWDLVRNPLFFRVFQPFGDSENFSRSRWCTYQVPLGFNQDKFFLELKSIGAGNEPQGEYIPLTRSIEPIQSQGSAMGPFRPWLQFKITSAEWNKVVPNINLLLPEIFPAGSEPVTFVWLDFIRDDPSDELNLKFLPLIVQRRTDDYRCQREGDERFVAAKIIPSTGSQVSIPVETIGFSSSGYEYLCDREIGDYFFLYPRLGQAAMADLWTAKITTVSGGILLLKPRTIVFTDDYLVTRQSNFVPGVSDNIHLEFTFQLESDLVISKIQFLLTEDVIKSSVYLDPLNVSKGQVLGLVLGVSIVLQT